MRALVLVQAQTLVPVREMLQALAWETALAMESVEAQLMPGGEVLLQVALTFGVAFLLGGQART